MTATSYIFREGRVPLLVGMPHVGPGIPDDIAATMTDHALTRADTDWHVDMLYDFLDELGASTIAATQSRYVIDLNRPPDGADLYPGRDSTELCPTSSFHHVPLYRQDQEPDAAEIARRIETYWRPYHAKLSTELARLKAEFGIALLWDAHSIRSTVPRLFDGVLPDFNLGTAGGASCGGGLAARVFAVAEALNEYSAVRDDRFKGGYVTRTYGRPDDGIHAIQLELSQRTYMDEAPPYRFRRDLAAEVRPVLRRMLEAMLNRAG